MIVLTQVRCSKNGCFRSRRGFVWVNDNVILAGSCHPSTWRGPTYALCLFSLHQHVQDDNYAHWISMGFLSSSYRAKSKRWAVVPRESTVRRPGQMAEAYRLASRAAIVHELNLNFAQVTKRRRCNLNWATVLLQFVFMT